MGTTHITNIKQLILLSGALLFIAGCNKSSHWSTNHVKTGSSAFDSSELCYRTSDPANGLDLAMIRTKDTLRFYLAVRSRSIPPYQNNPKQALVEILIDNNKYIFIAARHEGGQRLLLPEECQQLVLDSLKNNLSVTFQLSGYQAFIEPSDFETQFKKLNVPPLAIPFQLPF